MTIPIVIAISCLITWLVQLANARADYRRLTRLRKSRVVIVNREAA